jgi:hypothetical protein
VTFRPFIAYLNGAPLLNKRGDTRTFATVDAAKAAVADYCWDHKITLDTYRVEDKRTPT